MRGSSLANCCKFCRTSLCSSLDVPTSRTGVLLWPRTDGEAARRRDIIPEPERCSSSHSTPFSLSPSLPLSLPPSFVFCTFRPLHPLLSLLLLLLLLRRLLEVFSSFCRRARSGVSGLFGGEERKKKEEKRRREGREGREGKEGRVGFLELIRCRGGKSIISGRSGA